jgi:hypothetical protein
LYEYFDGPTQTALFPERTMSSEAKPQSHQGNYAGTIGLITGVVVYLGGKALFPATGSSWSNTGPRTLVLMAVAAGAAFLVTLVISLAKIKK